MAKVELHAWIKEMHGRMGDIVFKRSPSGKIIMSKLPDMSRVKWSKAQKQNRKRFKQAIKYAKAAMAEPKVRAVYEKRAAKENRQPFRVAVSDHLQGKDLITKK